MKPDCMRCAHEGPKFWSRGGEEEMRSYCFERKIYEPSSKACEKFKSIESDEQH